MTNFLLFLILMAVAGPIFADCQRRHGEEWSDRLHSRPDMRLPPDHPVNAKWCRMKLWREPSLSHDWRNFGIFLGVVTVPFVIAFALGAK